MPWVWVGLLKLNEWYFTREENSYIWTEYLVKDKNIVLTRYTQLTILTNKDGYFSVLLRNKNQTDDQKYVLLTNNSNYISKNWTFYSYGYWKEKKGNNLKISVLIVCFRVRVSEVLDTKCSTKFRVSRFGLVAKNSWSEPDENP